ncbi:serine/threonine-protein kinase Tor isoform X2 [Anopheles cruzii]|uniref:serine/threonine-protein kinase Tor isoform X2 n=1 Tax=Anopheles cruzii TaxID=68878 RepID=UPI0022EC4276|nr:serine/threonine-protein kinase Tor isoform X2 [Anopheles cruzii]
MSMLKVQQFVNGLRSRNKDVQNRAIQELSLYVKTELRETPDDMFFEDLNHNIFEMLSSTDNNEKRGGILAIDCLITGDVVNTTNKISRYSNNLRNLLPLSDVCVMELAAKVLVKLALLPGSNGASSFEFDIRRAFEWLTEDRVENKRQAAVLVLRELAVAMPTFFYQQVGSFFDHIFVAIKDPKAVIREGAGQALRVVLILTSHREGTKQSNNTQWHMICYDQAFECLPDASVRDKHINRDDRIHGSLIVFNEILRCSHAAWEKRFMQLDSLNVDRKPIRRSAATGDNEGGPGFFPRIRVPFLEKFGSGGHGGQSVSYSSRNGIQESALYRALVKERYDTICQTVLDQRSSKSPYVTQILLVIFPRLAAFNREEFVRLHLRTVVKYLLTLLRSKEKERHAAFISLGYIAVAVEREMEPYMKSIMELIGSALPPKDTPSKRKTTPVDPSVFVCVMLLGHALKSGITHEVQEIIGPMLSTGLSAALIVCLRELCECVPQVQPEVTAGLLKILSYVLMNRPLPQFIVPKSQSQQQQQQVHDTGTIVLALQTLGTFSFEGCSLLPFVQRCADHFLNSEQQEVRIEAVHTCTLLLKLALEAADSSDVSETLTQTLSSVLEKILMVGITDVDPIVRLRVLKSLDESFDTQLAQPWILNSLLVTMHDEVFEIRELAIIIIGRLSAINPAYVMPSLRKTMVQLLTELEHSGVSRNKEQSARMLDHLIVSTPRLVASYMRPILTILVPKLTEAEPNPSVVLNVLRAIGDLAEVIGGHHVLRKWSDELLEMLLDMLSDAGSTEKRAVALWTLGQLVSATGQVVEPYNKYPNLIDILINFLKTEQQLYVRRETIHVLGLLGALDPYKHKMNRGLIDSQTSANILISVPDSKTDDSTDMSTSEMLINMGTQLDEYYPAVVISTLMKILRDPTLSSHHLSVVQAITFTFTSLGIKGVPYLAQVLPCLLNNIETAEMSLKEYLFQQLSTLISIVKQHIIGFMNEIFVLIKKFWTTGPGGLPAGGGGGGGGASTVTAASLQPTIINLVEKIAMALGCEFKVYLPQLMPQILRVLLHDTSKDRAVTVKLLGAMRNFGNNLDDYLHLIIPAIVKLFEPIDIPLNVSITALQTINYLAEVLDFTDFSSRIVHPLVRVLDNFPELRPVAVTTLCSIMIQLGRKYLVFVPLVNRVMIRHKIPSLEYAKLLTKLQNNSTLALDDEFRIRQARNRNREISLPSDSTIAKFPVSMTDLEMMFKANRRVSKDDWLEWLRRLSIILLKESKNPALRSCATLAQNYPQLLKDLFNAAFVSCWSDLSDEMKHELAHSLTQALTVQDLPEITQTVLNLAEFMEHCESYPLKIDSKILGERAMECRAYAKALHYKEDEFHQTKEHQQSLFESLILINNKLQQKEAAEGLLEYADRLRAGADEMKVQVRWYEKLHSWEQARHLYAEKLRTNPNDLESRLGEMRCLEALGEWSELNAVTSRQWDALGGEGQSKAGRLAAAAAWGLQDWEGMHRFVRCIPEDTQDGAFYRAVLAVRNEQYELAQSLIDSTRDLLDTELTAMAGESYERAYGAMVCVQMLAELEEVIQYNVIPERRETIKSMWWDRLLGGQRLVEDWQRIIQVHSLVLSPKEDIRTWLKFASLCRKNGSLKLSEKTLVMLLEYDPMQNLADPLPIDKPHVTFAYTKHLHMAGHVKEAYEHLNRFVSSFNTQTFCVAGGGAPEEVKDENRRLLARCFLKLGMWQQSAAGGGGLKDNAINAILMCYGRATKHDPTWYKAWHNWAYMNFEVVQAKKQQEEFTKAPGSAAERAMLKHYAVPAVRGFFQSINLSQGNSLQDTLRLLTLWFDHAQYEEVHEALVEGMRMIDKNTWLQVIPQLIARIDTPRNLVGQLIHYLLTEIGKTHPQALVYPLTVASKSAPGTRKQAANKILSAMCEHSPTLVAQVLLISEELIRVAILWHEQWHEGLEEASRLYFGEHNVPGMFATLEPLHAMLQRGPQTLKESSFNQAYGRDLNEAQEWCKHYKHSRNIRDLNQAWDLYYHVFRRISRQLVQLTSLELQYVSPKLLACRDLELAVPGSYTPGQKLICISSIQTNLSIISSKQRPRKLCIRGSNGKDYMFLLKGHEDLRQDERVMQLFGLVNTLLLNDRDTFRRNLTIQRYAVIPLSTNSGLIGWVPHCDTLHKLIRDYRDSKKTMLNIEHRIMLRMAPDYDHLAVMQKVEVFEHALEQTKGDDLAKLLWLKSPSSEVWFDRRTNYIRSLAVMSMVGYILGLGDRHPSNLMLDRLSGKILHIDFGDCFEVAMTREKFPEKIPFRLTRMLINAMEVTGIEGTYRRTCESVMNVLRRNKDSLMAVLEAFVYDPLLNWRLLEADRLRRSKNATTDIEGTSGSIDEDTPLSYNVRRDARMNELNLGMLAKGPVNALVPAAAGDSGIGRSGANLPNPASSTGTGAGNAPATGGGGGGVAANAGAASGDVPDGNFAALQQNPVDVTNKKARVIVDRVKDKLTGKDFGKPEPVPVNRQIDLLIQQATNNENLCQCYIGWCPFW